MTDIMGRDHGITQVPNTPERNMTYKDTINAISKEFATRQDYINSEPAEIRDTIRWTQFVDSARVALDKEHIGSGLIHAYARELGV
jgi:hypothetical protein